MNLTLPLTHGQYGKTAARYPAQLSLAVRKITPPITYTAVGMQTLYNTVRATGANNIVLAGGIGNAGSFLGASNPPLTGTNLVYAIHNYDSKTDPDSYSLANWDLRFGDLSETQPVVMTVSRVIYLVVLRLSMQLYLVMINNTILASHLGHIMQLVAVVSRH